MRFNLIYVCMSALVYAACFAPFAMIASPALAQIAGPQPLAAPSSYGPEPLYEPSPAPQNAGPAAMQPVAPAASLTPPMSYPAALPAPPVGPSTTQGFEPAPVYATQPSTIAPAHRYGQQFPSPPVTYTQPPAGYAQPPAGYAQPPQMAYPPGSGQGVPTQFPAPSASDTMKARSLAAWNVLAGAKQSIQQGHPADALPVVLQFIAMKPLEPEGYFWQGVCYDNMGQLDQAIGCYIKGVEQVLKAGMDSAELRTDLGNDYLKQGRVDEAIDQYKRAVEVDRRQAIAHLNLGRAYIQKGDADAALACLQRAEDLHFDPAQLAYYRAKVLLQAGKNEDARTQLRQTLAKLPDGDTARRVRSEFAALLAEPNK